MTPGHVEHWDWERASGVLVPNISAAERMEWARLGRAPFLSFGESALRVALQRKVEYRANKIANARRKNQINHLRLV